MTRKSSSEDRKSSSFDPMGRRARSVLALRSSYPPLQVVFRVGRSSSQPVDRMSSSVDLACG